MELLISEFYSWKTTKGALYGKLTLLAGRPGAPAVCVCGGYSSGGLLSSLPGQRWKPAFHGTYNQVVTETFRISGVVLKGKTEALLLPVDDLHGLPGFSA